MFSFFKRNSDPTRAQTGKLRIYAKDDNKTYAIDDQGNITEWGAAGPQGPQGIQGPQGPQGIQGPEGPPGTTIHNDTTGIQGGAPGDYQHLTTAEKSQIASLENQSVAWNLTTSTGLYNDGDGVLSVGTGGPGVATTFSITDGSGYIETLGVVTKVTWTNKTDIAVTNIATQNITFVSIDNLGNVIQRATRWTANELATEIALGVVVHVNRVTVDTVNQEQAVMTNPAQQVGEVLEGLGFLNLDGNKFGAFSTNLQLNKTQGTIMNRGINWVVGGHENPHKLTLPVLNPVTALQYRMQDGTSSALTLTQVNPNIWDDGSAYGSAPSVPTNKFTVQRIYSFTSNNVKIQPGQAIYNSLAEAKGSIQTENFITEPSIQANGILRGYLCIQQGTTNLQDASKVFFLDPGKYGGGFGVGGLSVSTIQNTYDNSSNPEIITDSARGAVTIKRGSASDSDCVIEVQNGAGTQVFCADGLGNAKTSTTPTSNDHLTNKLYVDTGLSTKQNTLPNGTNVLNYLGWSGTSWIARNIDYSEIQNTPTIPTNYVTTNTTQSGLSGDKTWSGLHTFGAGVSVSGVFDGGAGLKLPNGSWIRPQTIGQPLFLTLGATPDISNSGLQLLNDSVYLSSGNGSSQTAQIVMSSVEMEFSQNSGIYNFSSVPTSTPNFYYGEDVSGNLVKFTAPTPTTPTLQQVTTQGASTNVVSSFTSRLLVGGATDDLSSALQVNGRTTLTSNNYRHITLAPTITALTPTAGLNAGAYSAGVAEIIAGGYYYGDGTKYYARHTSMSGVRLDSGSVSLIGNPTTTIGDLDASVSTYAYFGSSVSGINTRLVINTTDDLSTQLQVGGDVSQLNSTVNQKVKFAGNEGGSTIVWDAANFANVLRFGIGGFDKFTIADGYAEAKGKLLVNGATDDGSTALQVNGLAKSDSYNFNSSTAQVTTDASNNLFLNFGLSKQVKLSNTGLELYSFGSQVAHLTDSGELFADNSIRTRENFKFDTAQKRLQFFPGSTYITDNALGELEFRSTSGYKFPDTPSGAPVYTYGEDALGNLVKGSSSTPSKVSKSITVASGTNLTVAVAQTGLLDTHVVSLNLKTAVPSLNIHHIQPLVGQFVITYSSGFAGSVGIQYIYQ